MTEIQLVKFVIGEKQVKINIKTTIDFNIQFHLSESFDGGRTWKIVQNKTLGNIETEIPLIIEELLVLQTDTINDMRDKLEENLPVKDITTDLNYSILTIQNEINNLEELTSTLGDMK